MYTVCLYMFETFKFNLSSRGEDMYSMHLKK